MSTVEERHHQTLEAMKYEYEPDWICISVMSPPISESQTFGDRTYLLIYGIPTAVEWCNENCKGPWALQTMTTFRFKLEDDAAAFIVMFFK